MLDIEVFDGLWPFCAIGHRLIEIFRLLPSSTAPSAVSYRCRMTAARASAGRTTYRASAGRTVEGTATATS